MKKTFYKVALLLCLACFGICCGIITYRHTARRQAAEAIEEIREETFSKVSESKNTKTDSGLMNENDSESSTDSAHEDRNNSITTDSTVSGESNVAIHEEESRPVDIIAERGITIPEKNIDWDALYNQNPDIYAWIYVPGTNIDYPILQHPEETSYYLKHNIDGSEGYPGCIYTQNLNSKDWTDPNTVIYGHNMNDGSMFHDLHLFEDAVFFDETQYLYIYTPEGDYVYEIFAAYPFANVDLLMCFDYSTPEALLVYFDGIWTNRSMTSHFRDSIVLYGDSRIITMSTCIGGQPEMRYLVQAVLLNPEAK